MDDHRASCAQSAENIPGNTCCLDVLEGRIADFAPWPSNSARHGYDATGHRMFINEVADVVRSTMRDDLREAQREAGFGNARD